MLETNKKLKSVVESVQKKNHQDKDKKEDNPKEERIREAMYTRGESYLSTETSLLRDSFLLDSASDSHVSNNRDRFTDMRPAPADATLKSGGGGVKILGYGTVVIRPEPVSPGGDVELTLNDVAYTPDFPVNLVSYDIAISKQIFWDAERGVLTKKGRTFAETQAVLCVYCVGPNQSPHYIPGRGVGGHLRSRSIRSCVATSSVAAISNASRNFATICSALKPLVYERLCWRVYFRLSRGVLHDTHDRERRG